MSTIDRSILQRMFRQLSEDLKCASMEIIEGEAHSTETVSQHQEQLSWVQVQLAVAQEEHGRLQEQWHCIENQIKNGHSPY